MKKLLFIILGIIILIIAIYYANITINESDSKETITELDTSTKSERKVSEITETSTIGSTARDSDTETRTYKIEKLGLQITHPNTWKTSFFVLNDVSLPVSETAEVASVSFANYDSQQLDSYYYEHLNSSPDDYIGVVGTIFYDTEAKPKNDPYELQQFNSLHLLNDTFHIKTKDFSISFTIIHGKTISKDEAYEYAKSIDVNQYDDFDFQSGMSKSFKNSLQ
jgi:hypothetical protein